MTRGDILTTIDANRSRLSALGAVELALFGSHARGEAGPQSDRDQDPIAGAHSQRGGSCSVMPFVAGTPARTPALHPLGKIAAAILAVNYSSSSSP